LAQVAGKVTWSQNQAFLETNTLLL